MVETFSCFQSFSWLAHGFTRREEGINVNVARQEALARLSERHQVYLKQSGIALDSLRRGEQVHGNQVALVDEQSSVPDFVLGVDGLVTAKTNVPLGVYVADCCAIFLVETESRVIALLHSGKKGTELNIVRQGVCKIREICGGKTSNLIAALSPCIHACCYDVDFVSEIEQQLRAEKVDHVWRHADCTGCHTDHYYSYRKEQGKTGRMLAFMMIRSAE